MIETNCSQVVAFTKVFVSGMIARNRGHIVNMSSIAGHEAYGGARAQLVHCGFPALAGTEPLGVQLWAAASPFPCCFKRRACLRLRLRHHHKSLPPVMLLRTPLAGGSIYCGTKHFLDAFTTAARHDLVGTNVRVTAISPGVSGATAFWEVLSLFREHTERHV